MTVKQLATFSMTLAFLLLGRGIAFGGYPESSPEEKQEYMLDLNRIDTMEISLSRKDSIRDLKAYENFADTINKKWCQKNRADYARLMSAICRPLSSGIFKERRQHDLARKYALSILEKPDDISIYTELELIGCGMMTNTIGPDIPQGEEFAKRRKEDVAIRLHAWTRLINAIDPNWNSNDRLFLSITPPESTGFPSGVAPEAIKDAKLRKEYEAAIQSNNQKLEKHAEQHKLHMWLEIFPKGAEKYIVGLYSHPPFDTGELKKMLDNFPDKEAKARIIEAVEKNIR